MFIRNWIRDKELSGLKWFYQKIKLFKLWAFDYAKIRDFDLDFLDQRVA